LTVEKNPNRFLDTSIEIENGKANTSVYRKPNKHSSPLDITDS